MFHRRVYANHSSHVTKSRLTQKGKAYNCDVRLNIGNRLNPIDRRARRVSSTESVTMQMLTLPYDTQM